MSIKMFWHTLCDAPKCTATTTNPAAWTRIWSTAHIPDRIRKTRGVLSTEERSYGRFSLDLCPGHRLAFEEHLPITDSEPGRRGGDPTVTVACSCGSRLGWTKSMHSVGQVVGPRGWVEKKWWQHLPEELREYALRAGGGAA